MVKITGTAGNDYIASTLDEPHHFSGVAGDDTLVGGAFSDRLFGGKGDDLVYGGGGDDIISGGVISTGDDTLYGGGGDDRFELEFGNMLYFNPTGGSIYGGQGQDVLVVTSPIITGNVSDLSGWSAAGVEELHLVSNQSLWVTADFLNAFEAISVVLGGVSNVVSLNLKSPGRVDIVLAQGFLSFYGSASNDRIRIATNENTILKLYGGGGDDELVGGEGEDYLSGDSGWDTLHGGRGDDYVVGGSGGDTYIYGFGDGWDYLIDSGSEFSETDRILFGPGIGLADLTIKKNEGLSILVGSKGGIFIHTFSGWGFIEELHFENGDILDMMAYYYLASKNRDFISGFDTSEKISGLGGNDDLSGGGGDDTIKGGAGFDWLSGDAGDDLIDGGMDGDTMAGGTGNDTFIVDSVLDEVRELAGQGMDHVRSAISYTLGDHVENLTLTGSGSNTARGNSLANVLAGNAANNVLRGDTGTDTLLGGSGDDRLFGDAGDDSLSGGADADAVYGGKGNDILAGDGGNDVLSGGSGHDTIFGGTYNDLLMGDGGNDKLYGDSGNDTLIGGIGRDTLEGGAGADLFVFASLTDSPSSGYRDTINDFGRGADRIDLSGIDANTALAGDQAFAFLGKTAFSGVAGQLIFRTISGTQDSLVLGDVNGDGTADFSIRMLGAQLFSAGDFVL